MGEKKTVRGKCGTGQGNSSPPPPFMVRYTVSSELERKTTVTQANPLAKSAQTMSLNEKRLIVVAISKLKRDQERLETVEIAVSELARVCKVDAKNIYRVAKETTLSLLKQTIYVGGETADEGWTAFNWVSKAKYVPAKKHPSGKSVIQLDFHQDLQPMLLQLTRDFNSIPLRELLAIESFNSMRLFEILYHDSFKGQRAFIRYELEDLKKRIGLEGKYHSFKDFRYVLERAQQDIAEVTSLKFTFKGELKGRTCTHVLFHITPQSTIEESPLVVTHHNAALVSALKEAGFTQDPHEFIAKFGAPRVEANLALARKTFREAAATKNPIKNLGGLIAYMIENDIAANEIKKEDVGSTDRIKELAKMLLDLLEHERSQFQNQLWKQLPKEEREHLHDIMRVELERVTLTTLDAKQWKGRSYEAIRNKFLHRAYAEHYPTELQSLAAFVASRELFQEFDTSTSQAIVAQAEALA